MVSSNLLSCILTQWRYDFLFRRELIKKSAFDLAVSCILSRSPLLRCEGTSVTHQARRKNLTFKKLDTKNQMGYHSCHQIKLERGSGGFSSMA